MDVNGCDKTSRSYCYKQNTACCQYRGGGHWLVRMEWCPAGWSVCLPLLIFPCTIKSRSSLLTPAHLGGPRKRGHKTVVVCGGGVSYYWTTNNFTKCWLISSVCNKHRVLSVFSATDGHTVAVRNVIVPM